MERLQHHPSFETKTKGMDDSNRSVTNQPKRKVLRNEKSDARGL